MKDLIGSAGTVGGLLLRFSQFTFAFISFCVMVTVPGFSSVTAFWYVFHVLSPASVGTKISFH
jgi:hypothetical protein